MHPPASGERTGAILCARVSRSMVLPRGWDSTCRATQLRSLSDSKVGSGPAMNALEDHCIARIWRQSRSQEVDSRSIVGDGAGSRNSARVGGHSALQHGTSTRSRGTTRRRRRRATDFVLAEITSRKASERSLQNSAPANLGIARSGMPPPPGVRRFMNNGTLHLTEHQG